MAGIKEFNSIQPEESSGLPDAKTGRKFLFGALLIAILITGIAAAGYTMNVITKTTDGPYDALVDQVASEISLNEQQKSEVQKIKDDMNSKIGSRKIRGIKNAAQIETLFRSESFDRAKAMEIANSQNEENRELAVYTVDKLEQVHCMLTSKQRNDAVDKIKTLYATFKKMKR